MKTDKSRSFRRKNRQILRDFKVLNTSHLFHHKQPLSGLYFLLSQII